MTAEQLIAKELDRFGDKILLASSLGAEDQVLTDMVLKHNPKARIFILDTGRLHPETYDVIAATEKRYQIRYEIYFPEAKKVEDMVREKGINLFYESIEDRKACCHIRKVEPLARALKTCEAWIAGLRQSQSATREDIKETDWDATHNIHKFNPLATWSNEDVWAYIHKHNLPYNVLHDKGFPSIGCAPCTRAIEPGEDIRAGRWWWEQPENKECGIHIVDGKIVRRKS